MTSYGYLRSSGMILCCILYVMLFGMPASADIFQQDSGTEGIVSIEAENYESNTPSGSHTWNLVTPSGHSGSGAMQALPNIGANYNTDYTTASCRLDYTVNFVKTGVHYVWIRGQGATAADDSLHVGLDGAALSNSDRIKGFQPTWTWSKDTMDTAVATIDVATAGVHTINVWMREDGMVFDKLVLTTSSTYIPTETGPAESPQISDDTSAALVVTEEGNVGIGTASPNGKLDVDGSIMAGNSDIYFTKTDHQCTSIGNTSGYAAIQNAVNFDALMILGRAGTPKGRYVRLWDYLQVNGGMDITGNVGIGKSDPSAKLDVNGKIVMRNQTQNTDSADTVATKGYTDSKIAAAATFPASLTQNGYQKLPSGLIIQWGKVSGAFSGPRAVSFPTSFPNAALSISVSYDPGSGDTVLLTRNFNNSGVTLVATKYTGAYGTFNNPTIHYIAIGF